MNESALPGPNLAFSPWGANNKYLWKAQGMPGGPWAGERCTVEQSASEGDLAEKELGLWLAAPAPRAPRAAGCPGGEGPGPAVSGSGGSAVTCAQAAQVVLAFGRTSMWPLGLCWPAASPGRRHLMLCVSSLLRRPGHFYWATKRTQPCAVIVGAGPRGTWGPFYEMGLCVHLRTSAPPPPPRLAYILIPGPHSPLLSLSQFPFYTIFTSANANTGISRQSRLRMKNLLQTHHPRCGVSM